MRAAALIERAFRFAVPSRLLRPVAGGALLGAMALYTPRCSAPATARSVSTFIRP